MLHILNGEATEAILSQTAVGGERFSVRDALISGPTPAVNGSEWHRIRAAHLAEAYGVEFQKCEDGLTLQQQIFKSFNEHEEVTLWFESDLFCQANLLHVLDWCAHHHPETELSLICIGEFPGRPNFRGLGELTPQELASLFDKRLAVTEAQLELAARAWQAYRSEDPRELERLLQTDTSALPFLDGALGLQLTRFPSAHNGLNKIESTGLKLIDQGFTRFPDLFQRFVAAEPQYGLGDSQFWNALQPLKRGASPLLMLEGDMEAMSEGVFGITHAGRSVLSGAADRVTLNGIDEWLGGVHLQGHANIWRWDEPNGRLVKK